MRPLAFLLSLLALDGPARGAGDPRQLAAALAGRVWHDDAPLADGSFRMTCVIDELDASGKVTKRLVLEHRRTFRAGTMSEELLSAREDGVDVFDRQRKAEAHPARRGTARRWSLDDTLAPPIPFLGQPPSHYQLLLAAAPDAPGSTRLTFAPGAGAAGRRCASGHVELDARDGLPARLVFMPTPLPRMVRALTTTVWYGRVDGLAVPEATESVGEGGLLFLRKRFRVRMTYHDWDVSPTGPSARPEPPTVSENARR